MSPAQDELIVTVNAGSSSIKTGLFAGRQGEEQPRLLRAASWTALAWCRASR